MSSELTARTAADYAQRGWPVFPCHTPSHAGCSCCRPDCASPGKHPRTPNGLRDASTHPGVVASWWRRWPAANIGIVTGRPSGLIVIDIDPRHGGVESMQQLVRQHGPLPSGPRVRTGSGGWHLIYAQPDREIRNSVNRVGPGIDVRGAGGYVIAPPSLHQAGERYVWTRHGDPPQMPDWLDRLVDRPTPDRASPALAEPIRLSDAVDRWAAAAVDGEIERVRHAPEGCRNHTLNRAAFALGQIAGAGLLDSSEVETRLRDAAMGAGLGEREALLTIRSGISAGEARPRGPTERTPTPRPVDVPEVDLGAGLP